MDLDEKNQGHLTGVYEWEQLQADPNKKSEQI